jgi:hypothetical protein
MKLPQLPQDKANHFIYGAFIYALFALVFEPLACIFLVMSAAFFKEFYDTYTDSDFSFGDFFATTFGGLFSMLLINETTGLFIR